MSLHKGAKLLVAAGLAALSALTTMIPPAFAAGAGYSQFFIPGDEDMLAYVLRNLRNQGTGGTTMHSLVAVTAWAPNTIVIVDHWEDGYEYDVDDPTSSYDELFTLSAAGQAKLFEDSSIPLNRVVNGDSSFCDASADEADDSACVVDGRDIIFIIGTSATITRGTWLETGDTYQALAWEVYPVRPQLIKYVLPFGEELNAQGLLDFERVYALIQATEDNTTLQIDFGGDGTYDSFDHDRNGTLDGTVYTMSRGQVYLLDNLSDGPGASTLNTGTTILGSETLQVQYIVGDQGSNYEVRGLSAFPRGFWDDEYYAPVDETVGGTVTDIYLYNPHSSPLTINWETNAGSGSFTIGTTNRTVSFNAQAGASIPQNGAVYLSGSDVFWGVSSVDAEGQDNDWAYSLVPRTLLDEEYFLGWAPAYSFTLLGFNAGNPEPDASGLFITAAQDNTVVYVDEDVDGNPDQVFSLDRLQTVYVTSSLAPPALLDHDLSRARIYATGPYAMAFGQNPDNVAGSYGPALDLGYTVLPTTDRWFELVLDVEKSANPSLLGANEIGEITTFTLRPFTQSYSVDELTVVDTLPAGFEYVAGFTTVTLPDNTTVTGGVADDGNTTGATTLTWSGSDVFGAYANLAPNQEITISFRARTTVNTYNEGDLATNNVTATGTRTVQGIEQVFTATDFAFVTFSDSSMAITKTSDVDPLVYPGDTINYTVNITNNGTGPLNNITLFDALPQGVTYVPASGQISGNANLSFADFFNSSALNNNDGSRDWTSSWVESDATQSATAGNVRIESGELRIRTNNATATRQANLSGATNAVLTFDYSTTGNLDGPDDWFVEISGTGGAPFTNVLTGDDDATGSVIYQVPGALVTATTAVRIRTTGGSWDTNEYFEVDNLELSSGTARNVLDTFASTVYSRNDGNVNWVGNWVETDSAGGSQSPTAGNVQVIGGEMRLRSTSNVYRQVNLETARSPRLTLSYRTAGDTENTDIVFIEVATSPAGPFTTALTFNDAQTGTLNYLIPANLRSATTTIRFRTIDYVGGDEFFFVDNARVDYVEPEAVSGIFPADAPGFAGTSDGYVLAPGQSMVLTFQATVDDPLANDITLLTNQACSTATQINLPQCADVTDPVLNPSAETGEVGDLVWLDLNGDGIKDPGEPGLANVEVTLKDDFGTPIGVTFTDANGGYRFTGVQPGLGYFVEVTDGLPAGLTQTFPIGRTDGRTNQFDLASGQVFLDADLGFRAQPGTGTIGDYVWQDSNMNGLQEPGELGIGGVTVLLYRDVNNNGTLDPGGSMTDNFAYAGGPVAIPDNSGVGIDATINVAGVPSTITGVTVNVDVTHTYIGDLVFTLTSADGTMITLLDRPGVPASGFGCNNDDVNVSFSDGQPDPEDICAAGGGSPWPVSVAAPVDALAALIGEDANGTWTLNVSDNAGQDTGTIIGWDLDITYGVGGDGPPIATAVTAANGSYHFYNVDATDGTGTDDYLVTVDPSQPALVGLTASTFNINYEGDLGANDARLSNDFGYYPPVSPRYSYRDRVWFDGDENEEDDGESGVSGVTVNLLNAARQVVATVTTDADGYFGFTGLAGSTIYYVDITDVGGRLNDFFGTTPEAIAGELQLSNLTMNLDFTVEPTEPNFGYNAYGAVGDTVFNDLNGNGVQNGAGETGIAGVTVRLYNDDNGNGIIDGADMVIRTLTTDGNGSYLFAGVPNGDYIVSIPNPPSGFTFTGTDSDGTAAGDQLAATVTNFGADLSADFGYQVTTNPRSVSGTVFNDANNDGSITGDLGRFANVTIELRDSMGTFIGTTLTDASGNYSFQGLPPAAGYQIRVIDANSVLAGYQTTYEVSEGGLNGPYNSTEVVDLSSGSVSNIDFGYYRPVTTPLAVSLSSFHAERIGDNRTRFRWTTDTEVGNLGFYILGKVNDKWEDVSVDLIESVEVDSSARQTYEYVATKVNADSFLLVDVDVSGKARYHGPFGLGTTAISNPPSQRPVDWASVRAEHQSKVAQRRAAALSRGTPTAARLLIDGDGLYRLSYESLAAQGFDFVGTPVSSMGLFDRNGPVPMAVVPDGATFGPGMAIEFYGEASGDLYNKRNHYTLRTDQPGVHVQVDAAAPSGTPATTYQATTSVENDTRYSVSSPSSDPWYDAWIRAINGPASLTRSVVIEDLVPGAGSAALSLEMWGVTYWPAAPDHRVKATLNGLEVVDQTFDGLNSWSHQVAIDPNLLDTGANAVLQLQLPRDLPGVAYDIVAVDNYAITYPRRLTTRSAEPNRLYFSHPGAGSYRADGFAADGLVVYRRDSLGQMQRLTGSSVNWNGANFEITFSGGGQAEYFVQTQDSMFEPAVVPVPEPVEPGSGPAKYLVIAHPDFIDDVQPLVDYRIAQGYSADVVAVDAIYERFSNGMVDPEAIRAYIEDAVENRATGHVLLVGGDSYDYHDRLGHGSLSFIPSIYEATDALINHAPVDPLYGDVDRDGLVDVSVGRLPVRSSAEVAAIIAKVQQYEAKDYEQTLIAASDDYDLDQGLSYKDLTAQLLQPLATSWTITNADVETMGLAAAKQQVMDSLNQGQAVAQYFGHSSPSMWSFDRLFQVSDVSSLLNQGKPVVVTQWGCWNNYFVDPANTGLGLALVTADDRGAAASLGASTWTSTASDLALGNQFVPLMSQSGRSVGDMLVASKRSLASVQPGQHTDVQWGWTLLGDPLMVLQPVAPGSCVGNPASGDGDGDGICNNLDQCAGADRIGDIDGDGVCHDLDICVGFPDGIDSDGDGVPDGCDLCLGDDALGDPDGDGICGTPGEDLFSDGFESQSRSR